MNSKGEIMTNVPQSIGKYSRQYLEEMFSRTFSDYEWYVLQDGIDPDNIQSETGNLLYDITSRVNQLKEIVEFYLYYEPKLDEAKKGKQ
jgi:hypothetical protein